MNPTERLIALDYVKKRIEEEIKALRPQVLDGYRERMGHETNDDGTPRTTFGYYVGGQKVASFWFNSTKPEPERRKVVATCYDWDAALADENPDWEAWLAEYVKRHIGELAEQYVTETGDMLAGVAVAEQVTPARPAGIDPSGRFRTNPARIEQAMAPQLPSVVAGLLGGGA